MPTFIAVTSLLLLHHWLFWLVFYSQCPAEPPIWQVVHECWTHPTAYREFTWRAVFRNASQCSELFLFRGPGGGVRSEMVIDDSVQPLQGCERVQPSPARTREAPPLFQATREHPSQGGLVAAQSSHWAQASGFHRTALWVSLPGQGQPEFWRSRTILGNICTRRATNTFVFFQHSLPCLSQTPPFLQQKSQPWEECSAGLWEVFALSKWGLALGICEIISKEIISLRPTHSF